MPRERGLRLGLTAAEVVARARSAIDARPDGRLIRYKLGRGGNDPTRPHPATKDSRRWINWYCDCSGFVAWCLGIDRKQPDFSRTWIETTRMVADGQGAHELFVEEPLPAPGYVAVYPDRGEHEGHCAVVVEVPAENDPERLHGLVRVVHCSTGNQRRHGHAIAETDATLWRRRGGVWLRSLAVID